MLVLSRKLDESIKIGEKITLRVVRIQGDKVRIGIEAPKEVAIARTELLEEGCRPEAGGRRSEGKATDSVLRLPTASSLQSPASPTPPPGGRAA